MIYIKMADRSESDQQTTSEQIVTKEPAQVLRQKNPGRVAGGQRLQALMKERRQNVLREKESNKYYVGAGIVGIFILMYYFSNRQQESRSDQPVVKPVEKKKIAFDFDI